MRTRQDVENAISEQIRIAQARLETARFDFRDATDAIPSRLPSTDGALHISATGTEYRAALQALNIALRRFNEFMVSGIIPEDLD